MNARWTTFSLVVIASLLAEVGASAQEPEYNYWKRYNQIYDVGKSFLEHAARGQGIVGLQQGSYSYRWDLPLPPGRSGMAPAVALLYSSNGGRSPWGYGWNLSMPRIERSTKFGSPKYINAGTNADDYVYIDENGSAHNLIPVEVVGQKVRFRRMVESTMDWYIFDTSTSRWTILSKDGSKRTFGDSEQYARSTIPGKGDFAWYLDLVEDTTGNTIEYRYTLDPNSPAAVYPHLIKYTGNSHMTGEPGWGPQHWIQFSYASQPGTLIDCRRGACITLNAMRLSKIDVSTTGFLRKRFSFVYDTIDGHAMLEEIQFQAWNNLGSLTTLPPVTFTYQDAGSTFGSQTAVSISPALDADRDAWQRSVTFGDYMPTSPYGFDPDGNTYTTRAMVDMDGDGLKDIVTSMVPTSGPYTCHYRVHFGQLDGSGLLSYQSPTPGGVWDLPQGWAPAYYDPDPSEPDPTWRCPVRASRNSSISVSSYGWDLMDVSGDGRADLVRTSFDPSTQVWTYNYALNNGAGFDPTITQAWYLNGDLRTEQQEGWLFGYCPLGCIRNGYDFVDINGDGLPDAIDTMVWSDSNRFFLVHLNSPGGFSPVPVAWSSPFPTTHTMAQGFSSGHESPTFTGMQLEDMNGDGLVDLVAMNAGLVAVEDGPIVVALNNGYGFEDPIPWNGTGAVSITYNNRYDDTPPEIWAETYSFRFITDANGDGLPDLITQSGPVHTTYHVYLNNGRQLESTPSSSWTGMPAMLNYQESLTSVWGDGSMMYSRNFSRETLSDLNGDRRLDILMTSGTTYSWNARLGAFKAPLRLIQVHNGYQGKVELAYQSSVSTEDHQNPSPLFVVKSETIKDGSFAGHAETAQVRDFQYSDGLFYSDFDDYYRCTNNEFRGFGSVEEVVPAKDLKVTRTYYQDEYRKGLEHVAEWARISATGGDYIKHVLRYYQNFLVANGQYGKPDSKFYYNSMVTTYHSNDDPSHRVTETASITSVDSHGNVLDSVDYGVFVRDGLGENGHAQKKEYTYKSSIDLANNQYIFARKTESGSWQDALGAWHPLSSLNFYHDGSSNLDHIAYGLPTKVAKFVSSGGPGYWAYRSIGYHLNGSWFPAGGLVASESDYRGNNTLTTYDPDTMTLVASRQKGGLTQTFTHDASLGQPLSRTDENGKVWYYTYDGFGRILTEKWPQAASPYYYTAKTYTYGDTDVPAWSKVEQKILTRTSSFAKRFHDGLGRVIQENSNHDLAHNILRRLAYSGAGNLEKVSSEEFTDTDFGFDTAAWGSPGVGGPYLRVTYDPLDRVSEIWRSCSGKPLRQFSYDYMLGTTMVQYQNGLSDPRRVRTIDDGHGNVLALTKDYQGANEHTLQFTYDGWNGIIKAQDPSGNTIEYARNRSGWLEQTTVNASSLWNFALDLDGNLTQVGLPNGKTLSFAYDQHNRITHKEWEAGKYWDYIYDNPAVNGMGRLVSASGPDGNFSYAYDVRGNVLTEGQTIAASGNSYSTVYGYNLANLQSSLVFPGGGIQIQLLNTHNPDGTLKQMKQGNFCIQGTYTPARKAETVTASLDCNVRTDMAYSYDYDACDRLEHFVSQSLYPSQLLVLERTYGFFDNDKIKSIDDNTEHFDLAYDGAGRLQSISGALNVAYAYDTSDRVTTINRNGAVTTRGFGDSRFPWAATWITEPGSSFSTNLTYDAAGFLTTRAKILQPTYTETYDARGLMTASSISNGVQWYEYKYDHADGLMHQKRHNVSGSGTDFVGKLFERDYLTGKDRNYYRFNGQRVAVKDQAGAYQFFHPDQIQSVRFVTTPSGGEVSRHRFEPFGTEYDTLEGDLTRRAFNDRRKEGYKNLSRFPARMYDAWAHQWTALDPKALFASQDLLLGSGINPYAYCSNDPVNRYDPDGRQGIPADILPSNIYQGIPDISQGGRVRGTVTSIAGKLLRQMPGVQSFGELQQQAGSAALAARSGDKEAVKQIITGVVVGAVVAGIVKGVVDRRDNDKAQTDDPDKAKGKLSKKERREAERARSREAKHGDPDWEEPASERFMEDLGRETEKTRGGKDARRAGHDAKEAGEGDRSKRQAREDHKVDEE